MLKRPPLISVANLHKTFRLNICLLENRNLWTPLQSTQLENETFPNPYYLYFPITSTIAYMVVSMFDWVLLGSSVIGYSEIGFSLGSSVIGSSLGRSVIGSSLGYSVVGSSLGYSLESLVIGSSLGTS